MKRVRECIRLLNLPCEDITILLSRLQDDGLDRPERWAANLHLLYCSACRRFRKQLTFLRRAAHTASHQFHNREGAKSPLLSAEARQRLKESLKG